MHESNPRLDRREQRSDPAVWSSQSAGGVVACAHYLAADAGAEILAAGGNAADAAVAAGLALSVCEPAASGLGGMAMVVGSGLGDQTPFFLDGACTAPVEATPDRVKASHRYRGHRAVAVPGAVAAWAGLHDGFGRLPLAEVVKPAIHLARNGYPLSPMQHELAQTYRAALDAGNATGLVDEIGGSPRPIGSAVTQPLLAETLERLAVDGLMSFYHGDIAAEIDADMRDHDGFVRLADLAAVRRSAARTPIAVGFGPERLLTAGPPAGGLALAQLAMMSNVLDRRLDPREPSDLLLIIEMIRRVRVDRQRYRLRSGARQLGDAGTLLSKRVVQEAMTQVQAGLGADEPGETSHLCAMDGDGGCVAMTQSIERSFGSARMHPQLGFLYNGYLRGFKVENRRHPHYLRPGAPARSNAAPTIVMGPDRTIAIGSTGSERMVSGIFTTLLHLEREEPFAAVASPRVHCTPDGLLLAEWDRLGAEAQAILAGRYQLKKLPDYAFKFGGLQLAVRQHGVCTGVGEPRRDGGASAPQATS